MVAVYNVEAFRKNDRFAKFKRETAVREYNDLLEELERAADEIIRTSAFKELDVKCPGERTRKLIDFSFKKAADNRKLIEESNLKIAQAKRQLENMTTK